MYKELFTGITFGHLHHYGKVAALPITTPGLPVVTGYITLSEAIYQMMIRIEEVSYGGSVPELKVVSTADIPVLILAGEEVRGAKQNRILNTSILVPPKSEMVIPVSCTERGRWSYVSPDFKDSGNISSRDVRSAAERSVHQNLSSGYGHRSDQGEVWDKIEELHHKSKSDHISHTRAMDDAFKSRAGDLEEAVRQFSLIPGQTGVLFFHSGKVAGLDIISQPAAYARLHEKLVKSYVIDCLDLKKSDIKSETLLKEARHFLEKAITGTVSSFKSPGLGNDLRLQAPAIRGSMLEYNAEPVHTCIFRSETEENNIVRFYRRKEM